MNRDDPQLQEGDQQPFVPTQRGARDELATRVESSKTDLLTVVDRLCVVVDELIDLVETRREQR